MTNVPFRPQVFHIVYHVQRHTDDKCLFQVPCTTTLYRYHLLPGLLSSNKMEEHRQVIVCDTVRFYILESAFVSPNTSSQYIMYACV